MGQNAGAGNYHACPTIEQCHWLESNQGFVVGSDEENVLLTRINFYVMILIFIFIFTNQLI